MMNESTPTEGQGEVTCSYILTCDWRLDAGDDWARGNQLLDTLAQKYGLIGWGAGTGFGRRDMELAIPDGLSEEQFEALEADLKAIDLPDFQWSTYEADEDDHDEDEQAATELENEIFGVDPLELSDEAADKLLQAVRGEEVGPFDDPV